ncbi:MAG TPA: molybdenum ABC transporter ATP-binding protein [Pyrinomonadaceae bacterium]|nr:molybdenum ABC transporter ATP-binding protein [Pyrinomonadaceae bacterium]
MLSVKVQKQFEDFALDVEFNAPPGVTIIFGASGSGKTTTLKAIAGLFQPDAGRISIGERVLYDSASGVNLPIRQRRVGYVFQNLALFPHLSAQANVEFGMTEFATREERRARALELLANFRVRHIAARLPRHISGGEAQRVALARALASAPRLLLLDEPLSALDEETKLGIIADLKRLNRELRLPVVYVTHSREEASALGERAVVLERGRVVAEGEPEAVFDAPVRASVARLTGVENIFEGRVVQEGDAQGEDDATMTVELSGVEGVCRIEVPRARVGADARLTVAVRSGDIMLATDEPRGLSARNVLAGTIAGIEERGGQTLVRAHCGGVEWVSSVTRRSVEELGLTVGRPVWLAFKTYSCRVLDAED